MKISNIFVLLCIAMVAGCSSDTSPKGPDIEFDGAQKFIEEDGDGALVTGMVDVDGGGLYYEVKGSGEPMVLLHGFTLDTRMWDDQFDHFAENFRVIRFDHRGHGRSLGATEDFSQWDDVVAVLDELDVSSAHVVGMSMGGQIAVELALEHPDRVMSLVLLDAVFPGVDDTSGIGNAIMIGLTMGLGAGLEALKMLSIAGAVDADLQMRLDEMTLVGHLAQGDGALFINTGLREDLMPAAADSLGDISVPTLVIWGELDSFFAGSSDAYANGIPDATMVTIDGAGHAANMQEAFAVNMAMHAFYGLAPIPGPATEN